mmetsp:Transcript_14494/g.31442  ORF Transcript_14494/g.31442 Transcript_14494/m.31442 type:complete len:241 (-) Transcript_14494:1108-1830(-)
MNQIIRHPAVPLDSPILAHARNGIGNVPSGQSLSQDVTLQSQLGGDHARQFERSGVRQLHPQQESPLEANIGRHNPLQIQSVAREYNERIARGQRHGQNLESGRPMILTALPPLRWQQVVNLIDEQHTALGTLQHSLGLFDGTLLRSGIDQIAPPHLHVRFGGNGSNFIQHGKQQSCSVRLAAAWIAREAKVSWPIAFPRLDSAESIDFDGASEAADLVLDGVDADDLGELDFYGIVWWD